MTNRSSLLKAASLAVLAGALGPHGALVAGDSAGSGSDLFLRDSFFESFSARLADQLDGRMRHARRNGGGLHVSGLKGPDAEWGAYRAAAEYDPEVALILSAAEAERDLAREEGKSPFGPAMQLPDELGIFMLGDTGLGEARTGSEAGREFWTHSISGGLDYRFTDALLAGFAVSYSGGEADLGPSDYPAEAMTVSLFASLGQGPWHLDGSFNMGSLTFGRVEDRLPALAGFAPLMGTESTGDHVWTHVNAGYAFRFGDVEAGPVAEFRHARAGFDGFTDTFGPNAMTVAVREVDYGRLGVGAAASMDAEFGDKTKVNFWARATWQTGFGDSDPFLEAALEDGGAPVMIQGLTPDRSFVRTQLGLTADLGGGAEADFSYRTDLGRDDWQSHSIAASIRLKF